MIPSKVEGLRRVRVIRATQIPRGMKGNTHHSENNSGKL